MSGQPAYIITERGTQLVLITGRGELRFITEHPLAPAVPPEWLREVIRVRRRIGDPVTADFVYAAELPPQAPPDTALTSGDGQYWFYRGGQWRLYALKFSDAYIRQLVRERGQLKAAVRLIDSLIARLDPADYLTSGNAGGQSVSFPSLAEAADFYCRLRDLLLKEEAEDKGMNSGLMLKTKRRPVGGVLEDNDPWA